MAIDLSNRLGHYSAAARWTDLHMLFWDSQIFLAFCSLYSLVSRRLKTWQYLVAGACWRSSASLPSLNEIWTSRSRMHRSRSRTGGSRKHTCHTDNLTPLCARDRINSRTKFLAYRRRCGANQSPPALQTRAIGTRPCTANRQYGNVSLQHSGYRVNCQWYQMRAIHYLEQMGSFFSNSDRFVCLYPQLKNPVRSLRASNWIVPWESAFRASFNDGQVFICDSLSELSKLSHRQVGL